MIFNFLTQSVKADLEKFGKLNVVAIKDYLLQKKYQKYLF
jgi:hypothetical protein